MPIHDGPTSTSTAAGIGSPHPTATAGPGERRPLGTPADQRTGDTIRSGPPGVAHSGENGRPSPDDPPVSGPLFSVAGTGKAVTRRPARRSDPPIRTRRCSPFVTAPQTAVGAARAPRPRARRRAPPPGIAPKWGHGKIIPVRPTPDDGARIAKKAAFALVGSRTPAAELIFIGSATASLLPANASPRRRRPSPRNRHQRGNRCGSPTTKSQRREHEHEPPAPDASRATQAESTQPRDRWLEPHRPDHRAPCRQGRHQAASRPTGERAPAPPRLPDPTHHNLAERPEAQPTDQPHRPNTPTAAPPRPDHCEPTHKGSRTSKESHPLDRQTGPTTPGLPPRQTRGVRGVAPRADIPRDPGKHPKGAQHDKPDRVGVRGFEPRTSAV